MTQSNATVRHLELVGGRAAAKLPQYMFKRGDTYYFKRTLEVLELDSGNDDAPTPVDLAKVGVAPTDGKRVRCRQLEHDGVGSDPASYVWLDDDAPSRSSTLYCPEHQPMAEKTAADVRAVTYIMTENGTALSKAGEGKFADMQAQALASIEAA